LLFATGCACWLVLPMPLVEFDLFDVFELFVSSSSEFLDVFVVPVFVVPVFVVPVLVVALPCACVEVCTTPETSPTVSAPAAAAATVPARPALLRRFRPFMTLTIALRVSGRSHKNVKACSRPAGGALGTATERAAPG
jgi:hypothetical protein